MFLREGGRLKNYDKDFRHELKRAKISLQHKEVVFSEKKKLKNKKLPQEGGTVLPL